MRRAKPVPFSLLPLDADRLQEVMAARGITSRSTYLRMSIARDYAQLQRDKNRSGRLPETTERITEMNSDNPGNPPSSTPAEPVKDTEDFNSQPWQVLIGMRSLNNNVKTLMVCTPEAVTEGSSNRPDKRIQAVYFAMWLERNMAGLQKMAEVEYTQYINMRNMTIKPPSLHEMGLVDPQGRALVNNNTEH